MNMCIFSVLYYSPLYDASDRSLKSKYVNKNSGNSYRSSIGHFSLFSQVAEPFLTYDKSLWKVFVNLSQQPNRSIRDIQTFIY